MEKKELFEKAEKALNQALEAAKKSARVVAEKAGEAAHVTKLLAEKVSLEHRVTKEFTRLGSLVYEKATHQGRESLVNDPEVRDLVEGAKKLESDLAKIEAELEREKSRGRSPERRNKV